LGRRRSARSDPRVACRGPTTAASPASPSAEDPPPAPNCASAPPLTTSSNSTSTSTPPPPDERGQPPAARAGTHATRRNLHPFPDSLAHERVLRLSRFGPSPNLPA
jgi:hypothetical protein